MRKLFFFAIMALSVTLLSAQQDKKRGGYAPET